MPIKILWDWMVYWTITGHIVIQEQVAKPRTYLRHMMDLKRLNDLNKDMQAHFRRWNREEPAREKGGVIDTSRLCLIMDTNRRLVDQLSDRDFSRRFKTNIAQMETLFWEIAEHSGIEINTRIRRREHPGAVKSGLEEVFRIVSPSMDPSSDSDPDSSRKRPNDSQSADRAPSPMTA